MGLSSSKTKTKSTTTATPYGPATAAIDQGINAAQNIWTQNQPTLAQNASLAQNAFQQLAPSAFAPSPYVTSAQQTAQSIGNGAYLGNNPGASTYSSIQNSTNPAIAGYQSVANGGGLGNDILTKIAQGNYVGGQPSADLYKRLMDPSYLTANPYIDGIVNQSNADVTKAANQRFAASGMGSGLTSAFGDVLTKNLANSENQIRYASYNDASNRQLSAAGQSDAAYNTARANQLSAAQDQAGNQLSALGGLGSNFSQQQQNQLAAAQGADASRNTSIGQMLSAAGLQPGLAAAQYAGVDPALSLLNASSTIPFAGLNAYAGALGGLAGQYGTTNSTGTSKTNGSIVDSIGKLGQAAGTAAIAFSDIRLKKDVARIGELPDGLGVYAYRYIWDDQPQIGVMAHEIAALRPWALGPEVSGYKTVDYGAL